MIKTLQAQMQDALLVDIDILRRSKRLTSRQIEVVELLNMGYDRKGVATSLMPSVCVQADHQIILRIRKRLRKKNET